ncbi:MAG: peptide ABC transporter [Paracoccus denitrificans]|nr:MAG: peptide ABC transporter [Paracoccus denitrificans]PZO84638.1 MAG: peptide ABC transporter [Paracoccus denitrificans]
MRVFISADMEGTAGVAKLSECDRDHPDWQEFRALMTAEVVAACDGARAAGATEIVIKDAHESGRNLILEQLPPDAIIVRSWSGHPHSMMFGLERGFAAAIYTGYHDAAGTDNNPLAHSFTHRLFSLTINGQVASEFLVNAYTAASLGVPSVFLSGDEGMAARAHELIPAIETATVSQGFGAATRARSPAASRDLIREGVERGIARRVECLPALPDHFEVELRFTNPHDAYAGSFYPDVEYPAPRTLRFQRDNWFEVLRALLFVK